MLCVIRSRYSYSIDVTWQFSLFILSVFILQVSYLNSKYYSRLLRAAEVWKAIIENSLFFGNNVRNVFEAENKKDIENEIVYRHLAWLAALRSQLINKNAIEIDSFKAEVEGLISNEEIEDLNITTSIPGQLLRTQANRLQQLHKEGRFDSRRHMELFKQLKTFYEDQAKSEHLQTFSYLRHSVYEWYFLKLLLSLCTPICLMSLFKETGNTALLLLPFVSALIFSLIFMGGRITQLSKLPREIIYSKVPVADISGAVESSPFVETASPFAG